MAFAAYATTAELRGWFNDSVSVDEVVQAAALAAVTRWIDEFCQRNFWRDNAAARVFEASNYWCLYLGPFNDLVSASAVKSDEAGDGTFEVTWSASDYQLVPANPANGRPFTSIESVNGRMFPLSVYAQGRRTRVQVTGDWGWAAVPEAVKQACLIQAARVVLRRQSVEGVVGGFGDFGGFRVSARLDPDVEALLRPYVHPAAAVMFR